MLYRIENSYRNTATLALLCAVFFLACKTGSNYEALAAAQGKLRDTDNTEKISGTYYIRPLTFAEAQRHSTMYRRALVVPVYTGIDFDGFGRLDPADEKAGMRTIFSDSDVHVQIGNALTQWGAKVFLAENANTDDGQVLDLKVLSTESSLRIHTYGCWPFVGFFVYLFNGDLFTVLAHSRLEYRIAAVGARDKTGVIDVRTKKDFSFWSGDTGMEISDAFNEGQKAHYADIAGTLAQILLTDTPTR